MRADVLEGRKIGRHPRRAVAVGPDGHQRSIMSHAPPPRPRPLLEGCVTSVDEALRCARGGADRLELCVALETGGLTPPLSLLRAVKDAVAVPVLCMVRPRPGAFVARTGEVTAMTDDARALLAAGADGVVLGVLDHAGAVDAGALRVLVDAAAGAPVTFHRAFDHVRDRAAALETLVDAGVVRVLTAGGPGTAWDGREELRRLVDAAGDRIAVLAGGKVRADHAARLVAETGVRELHARAEAFPELGRALS